MLDADKMQRSIKQVTLGHEAPEDETQEEREFRESVTADIEEARVARRPGGFYVDVPADFPDPG